MNYKNYLSRLRCFFKNILSLIAWYKNGYSMPAPQNVKQKVLQRNGKSEIWVESGTYRGDTTYWLSRRFYEVFSIEPSAEYFQFAKQRFEGINNIYLFNDLSENVLNFVISSVNQKHGVTKISFWLDGHFSGGGTFQGPKDTPILQELNIIEENLFLFSEVSIFIDDFRLFASNVNEDISYPSKSELIRWADRNGFDWKVEHDIFILVKNR